MQSNLGGEFMSQRSRRFIRSAEVLAMLLSVPYAVADDPVYVVTIIHEQANSVDGINICGDIIGTEASGGAPSVMTVADSSCAL